MASPTIQHTTPAGINVTVFGELDARQREVLTDDALNFLAYLHTKQNPRRLELLAARRDARAKVAAGEPLDFEKSTRSIREDDSWRVAPLAPGLRDRRVEITGPVDRKMTINALNSGAKCWLADFEDASSPYWTNMINGQVNLYDAIRHNIDFTSEQGKAYRLKKPALAQMPTIIVRPRGLHLEESHIQIDGESLPASLMDFGLYFFHNGAKLVELGRGPYYYLPKLEHHLEARWWNCVFNKAQDYMGIPQGTIRATVLIETITAAFQMEEILYQLRNHAAGLNAGRWDYIFSIIKTYRDSGPEYVLPDRADVSMTQPMMRAYTDLLVHTCHKRGASAIGGMSAFIPDSSNPERTKQALAKVREDKTREANDGFDGSWVAHPGLVPTCMGVFDELLLDAQHQIRTNKRQDVVPYAQGLTNVQGTTGSITEAGLETNIEVGIRYMDAWLNGSGAAAINGLMEDAATAEISRSQIWQWIRWGCEALREDGSVKTITTEWVTQKIDDVFATLTRYDGDRLNDAKQLFAESALSEDFEDFLTIPAYERYLAPEIKVAA
ncbi:malate synthase A [Enteractinococcus coprophilus]|uniref:Malate synthase n=1 Tax=Enteractinococcus coprophilus TaxID=1027633 RepID=A0A543AFZ3_9MICC|nr:malate synthase A [Enteractinococcus coprophilus]TQL71499.1 malate synthase [Enteractinococcus coprophilus]